VTLASSAQGRRELELIDNALARIRVLQLASVAAQEESGAVRWHVEIPVAGPAGQIERLEIEVHEQPDDEANHSRSRRRDPAWQVVLHLEPPELGRLEARIVWRAGAVSARLVAARASTAQALQHDLARLEAGLREAGLTVEALRCEHGEPAGPAGPTGTQPLVHVVV